MTGGSDLEFAVAPMKVAGEAGLAKAKQKAEEVYKIRWAVVKARGRLQRCRGAELERDGMPRFVSTYPSLHLIICLSMAVCLCLHYTYTQGTSRLSLCVARVVLGLCEATDRWLQVNAKRLNTATAVGRYLRWRDTDKNVLYLYAREDEDGTREMQRHQAGMYLGR